MTPPAGPEPVFGILQSELYEWERENLCWSEVRDLQRRIRARGPAVEQAPAVHYCTHLKWLTQIEGDGDYRCELGNKTSCEWCEGKSRCGDYQSVHDAALIAQEREKWERERLSCVEDITLEGAAIVQAVKKQAREDMLKEAIVELNTLYKNYSEDPHQSAEYTDGAQTALDLMEQKLESLRSEVRK